ncbi:DUF3817 domain-containing protein [Leucothrix arctica]|uniref:DUF3817 domain-containing protein n=1 Tax=Leucothrix arctica TaxID=1481894 RepID=A0A317CDP5_9GAMM|nr:DUF3817 domain-containing protein [Leucothrix arctica]PWQ96507.1 DUF3817 domain-containing protein [Leucothrix arctica]
MKYFRMISFIEGMSYLLILSVTLGFISRDYVSMLGMGHGVLFILYVVLSLQVTHKKGWSILVWLLLFVASLVPFAFIAVEVFIRKEMAGSKATAK